MEKFSNIFVVLTYKNYDDLKECLESIKLTVNSYKVIVVNSYFDDLTKNIFETIAKENDCDFINVENKGYSYGNNVGIDYAIKNYDFDHIVVSNPDIIIKKYDQDILDKNTKYGIIAPKIIARSGKLQNPMCVKKSKLSCRFEYRGFKKDKKFWIILGIGINKINRSIRTFFHFKRNKPYKIYAAHGSFVILKKDAVLKLNPVYDENMFLFGEESVLAERAKKSGILVGQFNSIVVNHKEDGSMKLADFSINDELKKSNIYYYENYIMKK